MENRYPLLEVCAGDIDSVYAAAQGGAARVELCSALYEGGITPSASFIRKAREVHGLKVHVLIRPRGGDFLYTPVEINMMCEDIRIAVDSGADGVVIGALDREGRVDKDACAKLMAAANGIAVTFHRAIDMCRDAFEAIEDIAELGCNRILTSGLASSAYIGADMLRHMQIAAGKRMIIIAAGGVNAENATDIISRSGCMEIHASARQKVSSGMLFRRDSVSMGAKDVDEYSRLSTNINEVRSIVEAISNVPY